MKQTSANRSRYSLDAVELVQLSLPHDIREGSEGKMPFELQRLASHLLASVQNCKEFPHPGQILSLKQVREVWLPVIRFLACLGVYSEAESVAARVLSWRETGNIPWSQETIEIGLNLAVIYQIQCHDSNAIGLVKVLITQASSVLGSCDEVSLRCKLRLGQLYLWTGSLRETVQILAETYDQQCATVGPKHITTPTTLATLGQLHQKLGRNEDSIKCLKVTYTSLKSRYSTDHATRMEVASALVLCFSVMRPVPQDAVAFTRSWVGRLEDRYGESHRATVHGHFMLSRVIQNTGDLKLADHIIKSKSVIPSLISSL